MQITFQFLRNQDWKTGKVETKKDINELLIDLNEQHHYFIW